MGYVSRVAQVRMENVPVHSFYPIARLGRAHWGSGGYFCCQYDGMRVHWDIHRANSKTTEARSNAVTGRDAATVHASTLADLERAASYIWPSLTAAPKF